MSTKAKELINELKKGIFNEELFSQLFSEYERAGIPKDEVKRLIEITKIYERGNTFTIECKNGARLKSTGKLKRGKHFVRVLRDEETGKLYERPYPEHRAMIIDPITTFYVETPREKLEYAEQAVTYRLLEKLYYIILYFKLCNSKYDTTLEEHEKDEIKQYLEMKQRYKHENQ